MSVFDSMNVTASGLTMQRLRMDVISQNLSNVSTTKTADGTPYKRKVLLIEEQKQGSFADVLANQFDKNGINSGVKVTKIVEDNRAFNKVYDPGHPDADDKGYVSMPNVNVIEEMVNMISASRSYEANVTCLNGTKSMGMKAIDIGK